MEKIAMVSCAFKKV
jgi:hypothetical protein